MINKTQQYPYNLTGHHKRMDGQHAITLECGVTLDSYNLSYTTYGTLNDDKSNAILIFHALTGDQYVAMENPITKKPGWWQTIVGENKPVDTTKYFVLCINVLGGCMGSEGPKSINPKTGKPWGVSFPIITITDIVNSQVQLLNYLGIEKLHSVIGGSMGGMCAMYFASQYEHRTKNVAVIASSTHLSPRNIGMNEVARQSIMADLKWNNGDYYNNNSMDNDINNAVENNTTASPKRGLAIARMAAHITYLSEKSMYNKFGRNLQDKTTFEYSFLKSEFQVENYLKYQGKNFIKRFDANSYLYLTKAMDYFDLSSVTPSGNLTDAFKNTTNRFCVVSISSDWLHPTKNSMLLVRALNCAGANVSFTELVSDAGHDAFLLNTPEFISIMDGFINDDQDSQQSRKKNSPLPLKKTQCSATVRADQAVIMDFIPHDASILDVGCGAGTFMTFAKNSNKNISIHGIEKDPQEVRHGIVNGHAIIQGDANTDLSAYPTNAFDVVVLSKTLQAMKEPHKTLNEITRIGKKAIVGFPNFGNITTILDLFKRHTMPVTKALPLSWYETPNIHFCTIRDFVNLCDTLGLIIEDYCILDKKGRPMKSSPCSRIAGLFGSEAVFVIRAKEVISQTK